MEHGHEHKSGNSYGRLIAELALDFVAMYLVMYAMIATLAHFHLNLNNVYMTLMMIAPMTIIMLVSMRSMFPSRPLNLIIGVGAVAVFLGSFAAMRTQAGVGNADFLRSMIPHHSGAILMCEQASISDPEIIALCKQIISSQQREITQMEAILARH
ncbi:DUF305 domain-containing protein [Bosea beijingensis]